MRILTPNNIHNTPPGDDDAGKGITGKNQAGSARRADTPEGDRKGLSKTFVASQLKFVLFLAGIGIVFIWNAHLAERRVKEFDTLKKEVKKLRDDYMMKESILTAGTSYAQIAAAADTLGLMRIEKPPFRIVKEKKAVKE